MMRIGIASAVAAYMARSGYKKKSLTKTGAIAAFIVGFSSMATGYRFGTYEPHVFHLSRFVL